MARVLGAVKVQVHVIVSSPLKRSLQTVYFFFFNDTAPTKIYTLSLHDALPICAIAPGPIRPAPARLAATRSDPPCSTTRDRKSTRLNSSHLGISYAVFCLK